jgi:hypothetical protein
LLLGEIGKLAGRGLDIPLMTLPLVSGAVTLKSRSVLIRSRSSFAFDKLRSGYAMTLIAPQ